MTCQFTPLQNDTIHPTLKSVYQLVASGGAFKNPVAATISSYDSGIVGEMANLQALTLPIYGEFGDEPITTVAPLISKLSSLRTSLSDVQTHTNRLSGVDLASSRQKPIFPTLLSVGFSYTRIKGLLGESTDNLEAELFQSLFSTPETLGSTNASSLLKASKMLEARRGKSNPLDTLTLLNQRADSVSNTLDSRMELDNLAFENFLSVVTKFSLAQTLHGLPTGVDTWSNCLVQNHVGTPTLTQLLATST